MAIAGVLRVVSPTVAAGAVVFILLAAAVSRAGSGATAALVLFRHARVGRRMYRRGVRAATISRGYGWSLGPSPW